MLYKQKRKEYLACRLRDRLCLKQSQMLFHSDCSTELGQIPSSAILYSGNVKYVIILKTRFTVCIYCIIVSNARRAKERCF